MKDIIMVVTSCELLLFSLIDYFDVYSFGAAASIIVLNALVLMYELGKDKK